MVDNSPLPAAVQDTARDAATAADDGDQDKEKADYKERHQGTNNNSYQVFLWCVYAHVCVLMDIAKSAKLIKYWIDSIN